MTFSDNRKLGFKWLPYIKHNNSFLANKNFNKIGTKPNVAAQNTNQPAENKGAKASPMQELL